MEKYELVARDAVTALEVVAAIMGEKPLAVIAERMREKLDACGASMVGLLEAEGKVETAMPAVVAIAPIGPAPLPDKPHGKSEGTIPKGVRRAKRLRLVGVGSDGEPTGYVDEGTAVELANRNRIAPSTIYRIAGSDAVANGFRVEKVLE